MADWLERNEQRATEHHNPSTCRFCQSLPQSPRPRPTPLRIHGV
jgi:hypothetical protein